MTKKKKIILSIVSLMAIAIIVYVSYMCIHYFYYNKYQSSLVTYDYEEGKEYTPLTDSKVNVSGMELAAENEYLKLYTNKETTEIAVYDKRTGETTYSNPPDRENDSLAAGTNKSLLNSQLIIDYYDTNRTIVTMNSYDLSTKNGQFTLESLEDGIRYTYTFGDLSSATGIVPVYITEERLQTLVLDKVTEKEAKTVKAKYSQSKSVEGFLELAAGATKSKVGMKKLNAIFESAGYTEEDFMEDKAAAMGEEGDVTTFTIPLEYRLVEDNLVVTIPSEHIEETGSGKLATIQLLRYFGAGSMTEDGYMLVPNGSGSLINFNNGKKNEQYNQYIYGMDPVSMGYTVVESTEKARLPIFGIKKENTAIFASIESGDTLANIIADVSGKLNSYNYVFPTFHLREGEKLSMFGTTGAASELPVVEKDLYKLDLTVKYSFLEKEEANYSGMANHYRQELIDNGTLQVKEEKEDLPFYLDILGGVQKTAFFAGVPYESVFPMTTFENAETILDEFYADDISNIRMNYLGWFNGGYYHDVADKITGLGKLGGKKDLESLSSKLEESGGKLYVDVAFQNVSYSSKRFNYKLESSRYYTGMIVSYGRVNPATLRQTSSLGYMETLYDSLSPKFLVRYVDKFSKKIDSYEVSGIGLRDLGDVLQSDKKRKHIINREEAKYVVKDQLETLANTNKDLLINGGNYYSLEYATDAINVPTSHSKFFIIDEEIPFYEMVIHGCIDYTGESINVSDSYDEQDVLLRMLEYGAAPHFTFSYEDSSNIKYTGLNDQYATYYKDWIDDAKSIYKELNGVLKNVTNSSMIGHEILESGVVKVSYDNGVILYINKNNTEASVDGQTIEPRNYRIEGVAQ